MQLFNEYLAEATKKTELKTELKKVLDVQTKQMKAMESQKDNPSVSKNYYMSVGRVEAFEAVIAAVDGNFFDLRLMK